MQKLGSFNLVLAGIAIIIILIYVVASQFGTQAPINTVHMVTIPVDGVEKIRSLMGI